MNVKALEDAILTAEQDWATKTAAVDRLQEEKKYYDAMVAIFDQSLAKERLAALKDALSLVTR